MAWFLYDKDLRHVRVKWVKLICAYIIVGKKEKKND